jgi:hypothetical protein
VEIGSTRAPMTTRDARPIVCRVRLGRGFFYSGNDERTPPEVWILRTIGGAFVVLFVVKTLTTDPKPALHGDGLGVLLGLIGFTVGVVLTNPRSKAREPRRTGGLLLVIASSAVLAGFQPDGVWQACPYFVAIVGAVRFDWKRGVAIYGLSLVALTIVAAANGRADDALNVAIGSIPWFLVLRLMRRMREYGEALELSQEAEAAAAADAERGRVAREMHDVLAHSLSALALQLESARLVAATAAPTPRWSTRSTAPTTRRSRDSRRRGGRSERCAATPCRGPSGCPRWSRRSRSRAGCTRGSRPSARRDRCPPTRAWLCTAPPRRL